MGKISFVVLFLSLAVLSFGQKPELVLPTLHSAAIGELSFSADGKYLASCAGNEIKLWEVASGRLLRTILAPDPIEHIALSKDGTRLVSGSYCGMDVGYPVGDAELNTDVRVWDMVTGKPIRTLKSFGKPVCLLDVGISPDMKYAFAYVMGDKLGAGKISIWDINTGKEQGTLPKDADAEYSGVSFSADSKHILLQVAGSIWEGRSGVLQWADWATGEIENSLEETCLAVVSSGDEVIAFTESGWLKRWNSLDKTRPEGRKLDIMTEEPDRPECVFSSDGARLCMLSKVSKVSGDFSYNYNRFRVFDTQSGTLVSDHTCAEKDGNNNWALSPGIGLYVTYPRPPEFAMADALLTGMRAYSTATGAFSHSFGLTSLEKTITSNALNRALYCQVFDQGKLFSIRRDTNRVHAFEIYNTIFLSEKGQVITGVEPDSLPFFTADHSLTEDKRWKLECTNGLTYQLTDTGSGQVVATLLLADVAPTILSESGMGEEVWADATSHTWAVTTPSGLFDASPDMMRSLHYVSGLEIIDLDQLKERYYEPGLLAKILGLNKDAVRSVENFNEVALYPDMTAQLSADQLQLAVTLTPRNGGIGKLSLFVNGKEVLEDANPQRAKSVTIDLTQFAEYFLPGENNILSLRVYNQAGWLKSSPLELNYQPPATARGTSSGTSPSPFSRPKPALYAIVVGTADYAGDKLDLKYADLDAAYFSQALQTAAPGVYADKVAITLLSTQADAPNRQGVSSKAAIRQAFTDLAGKAKAQDVLVIYFSGHGVTYGGAENAQFYYLTKDIASENLSDPEIRNNYAISSTELTEWIKAIPALKQVMVIDACNSGKIVEDLAVRKDLSSTQIRALDRMKDRTGMFILTGSAADKVSYEAGQYGQGLLTFSLLEGMSGPALSDDKRVDVMSLFQHARNRVPDLARGIGGIQTPVLAFPAGGASFDIGIVGPGAKIPLAKAKPVFVRNNFQDEATFGDELGLTEALADYFRSITAKGAQSELLYWDVNEYENAYAIKGRYTLSGDAVTVRARLFKGKTVVGQEFTVTGNKSALPALVEALVGKVQGMVR